MGNLISNGNGEVKEKEIKADNAENRTRNLIYGSILNESFPSAPETEAAEEEEEITLPVLPINRPATSVNVDDHRDQVTSIDWSPDGKFIVTGSGDWTARIWDATTGQCRVVLEKGHTWTIFSVSWSCDGNTIATGSSITIRLWNITSLELLTGPGSASKTRDPSTLESKIISTGRSITGHSRPMRPISLSRDGKYVVTGDQDFVARVWDISSGQTFRTLPGHQKSINSVKWSPDNASIVTGSQDGTARIWNFSTELCTAIFNHTRPVVSVSWSPDSKWIATASKDTSARVWGVSTGQLATILEGHDDFLSSVDWSPYGESIVTGSRDNTARIWDVPTGNCIAKMKHTQPIFHVGWAPNGKTIVAGSEYGIGTPNYQKAVRFWNLAAGECPATMWKGLGDTFHYVGVSPNGLSLITEKDAIACIWSVETGQRTATLKGHNGSILTARWSRDNMFIVTGSRDFTARIWIAETGVCTGKLEGHLDNVLTVEWSPTNELIVTGSNDSTARVWDASSGQCIAKLEGHDSPVVSASWSSDGTNVATGSIDRNVFIWDAQTGEHRTDMKLTHSETVLSVDWFGKWIVTASDMSPKIWHIEKEKEIHLLEGHTERVFSVAWSPNGEYIVSGSHDTTARIWHVAGRECVAVLKHENFVKYVQWSPDKNLIMVECVDKTAYIWDLSAVTAADGRKVNQGSYFKPLSPLTINDYIMSDLETAANPSYTWPRFQSIEPGMLRFALTSDLGALLRNQSPSRPERCSLLREDHASWENPLHFALRNGQNRSAALIRMFLKISPFEAIQRRRARTDDESRPGGVSLLMRALEVQSLANVILILSVYTEFLTLPEAQSEDEEERQFLKDRNTQLSMWVFKGYEYHESEKQVIYRQHCADHIDVFELCEVAKTYPRAFLEFTKTLQIVPNYDFVCSSELALAPMGDLDRFLAGSQDRVPGAPTDHHILAERYCVPMDSGRSGTISWTGKTFGLVRRSIQNRIRTFRSSSRLDEQDHDDNDGDSTQDKGSDTSTDDESERSSSPFWNRVALEKIRGMMKTDLFRLPALGSSSQQDEQDAVVPAVIPLRNIAGLKDSGEICPFLEEVVRAAADLSDFSVFENKVVQCLVEFKWKMYVRRRFYMDAFMFCFLCISFISAALLFERYPENDSHIKVAIWILLTCTILLIFHFSILEIQQMRRAWQGGDSSIESYIFDGWNLLDIVFLLMLFSTCVSQICDINLPESRLEKEGWNIRSNNFAAVSVVLMAFQSLFYLKALQECGAFVRMAINITVNIWVFCLILLLFILTFSIGLLLVFQPADEHASDGKIVFDGAYWHLRRTILTTFTMLLGDINLGDLFQSSTPWLAAILVVIFLFASGVILLNMLIAIMADLYDEVQEHALAQSTYARARLILEYEGRLSNRDIMDHQNEWFPAWVQVLEKGNFDHAKSSWEGRVKAVTKPLVKNLDKMNGTTTQRLEKMERRLDMIEGRLEKMEDSLLTIANFVRNIPREMDEAD